MSIDLLKSLATDSSSDTRTNDRIPLKQIKAVQVTIDEDEISDLILVDPSVSLFHNVTDIGWNLLEKNYKGVAKSIVHCLEEQIDIDGSLIILAYPGLHGLLLSLAYDILNGDNEPIGEITNSSVLFDVDDMKVLLCCF